MTQSNKLYQVLATQAIVRRINSLGGGGFPYSTRGYQYVVYYTDCKTP